MRRVTLMVVLVGLATALAGAQEPRRAFEVASVKRNMLGAPGFGGPTATSIPTPTSFSAINFTLPELVRMAYELGPTVVRPGQPDERIVGGPSWVQTQRFDITARSATEVSREQMNAMLRTLLEDRFKLVVAREQRGRDAYALRLARADGRLGPDLRKAAANCNETRPTDPFAQIKLLPAPSNGLMRSNGGACTTIDSLARGLERTLNAAVTNETGLTGSWDYVIAHAGLQSGTRPTDPTQREYPSVFTAVEEQLGLKLERRREPASFDVLVIKSVELPSEN